MKDLAFIYVTRSSFVAEDWDILGARFDLEEVVWRGKRSIPALARAVLRTRANLSWFASHHAYGACKLGRPMRKPSMVIVGGPDASYVPELGAGILGGAFGVPSEARMCTYVYRHAAGVFPVDPTLADDLLRLTGLPGHNVVSIPTGYDPRRWHPAGPKEDLVLTVAGVNASTLQRKGIATFAEAARLLPQVRFAIVGAHQDEAARALARSAPPNLAMPGEVPQDELLRWYQRAKVYCQLSRHEGLPNALCEAMLCEAVPVGTPHYGIPGAIGDTGPIVPWRDARATADAVLQALASRAGPKARERIARLFPRERRERELTAAVEAVLEGKPVAALPFARSAAAPSP